ASVGKLRPYWLVLIHATSALPVARAVRLHIWAAPAVGGYVKSVCWAVVHEEKPASDSKIKFSLGQIARGVRVVGFRVVCSLAHHLLHSIQSGPSARYFTGTQAPAQFCPLPSHTLAPTNPPSFPATTWKKPKLR